MRTNAYKKLIRESFEAGEIPQELYDEMTAKIESEGKMTPALYLEYLEGLEKRGLFDVFSTPYDRNAPPIDETCKYESKNFFFWIVRIILTFVFIVIGFLVGQVFFGIRVKGRKNMRSLKTGAISVTNHISYLDCFLIRRAVGLKSLRILVAPHNSKPGIGRFILTAGGVVPIGTTVSGVKAFNRAMKNGLKKGKIYQFYAERSMWLNYDKPRPLKSGAFKYAAMMKAPIIPIFYVYRKNNFMRRLLRLHAPITIVISEPLYIDENLPTAINAKNLQADCETRFKEIYERYKGEKLIYLNGKTLPYEDRGANDMM